MGWGSKVLVNVIHDFGYRNVFVCNTFFGGHFKFPRRPHFPHVYLELQQYDTIIIWFVKENKAIKIKMVFVKYFIFDCYILIICTSFSLVWLFLLCVCTRDVKLCCAYNVKCTDICTFE